MAVLVQLNLLSRYCQYLSQVNSDVARRADDLVVNVGVDSRCRERDDFGCRLLHLESHDGGFCIGFDIVPIW